MLKKGECALCNAGIPANRVMKTIYDVDTGKTYMWIVSEKMLAKIEKEATRMPEPGTCPVCGDELEYTGVGKGIPTQGKVCFSANCLCGYHTIERYEYKGLERCSFPTTKEI